MAICQCQGYMLAYPIQSLNLSAKPSVVHCFCNLVHSPEWFFVSLLMRWGPQGFDRSEPSIWHRINIPFTCVRFHHRHVPPLAVLALATELPTIMGTLGEHAAHPLQHVFHAARDGDQLLVVVPHRVRVPVPHPEAQDRVVEQVQLCDKCGNG